MNKNVKYFLFAAVILLIGFFFFFKNDKACLKKKTIKLVKLSSSTSVRLSDAGIFKRIHKIAKYMYFLVQYEIDLGDKFYQDQSLAEFKSLLFAYFKQADKWQVDVPLKQDFNIEMSASGKEKNARVSFPIKIVYEENPLFCTVVLSWVKENKWLVHNIKVSSCSSQ